MNYHIASSSTVKRSMQGKKLQYQERISENSILPQTTTLSPAYLTADSAWRTVATIVSPKPRDGHKRQVEKNLNLSYFVLNEEKKYVDYQISFSLSII
jgi:hypothetical protein